jgi:hypothetical protein
MVLAGTETLTLDRERQLNQDFSRFYQELDDDTQRFKHITRLYRNYFDGTAQGYAIFAQKLGNSDLCKNADFEMYTSLHFCIQKGTQNELNVRLKFMRTLSGIKPALGVRWYERDKAVRLLGL